MRLPGFTRSIRFRLSGLTSAVVFGLGGLALAVVYFVVLYQVRNLTMRAVVLTGEPVIVGGRRFLVPQLSEQEVRTFESLIKEIILNRVAWVTLAVVGGLFLLSVLVGWLVAGRALRPVARLTAVAAEIEATDLSRRIRLAGADDELTRMASTFDSMLDRLDGAFQSQRTFLAQTSHDLRTPLAVIRSNLDVTRSDPEATVEDWRATGEVVARAAERMSGMIDGLLAAARLETEQAVRQDVDLAGVVTAVAGEHAARAEAMGRSLEAVAGSAVVRGDPAALGRAAGNLIDNALRAAPAGTGVTVGSGRIAGWGYVAVADRGPGIDPATVEAPGAGGLGLSIVRRIADAHGGTVAAGRRPAGGSLVVVWLPLTEGGAGEPPGVDAHPLL